MSETSVVEARHGKAVRLKAGEAVKVINTHGTQVVDTWALRLPDFHDYMSMPHTRVAVERLIPRQGEYLVTQEREPILLLEEDTTPGIHDTLCAACDAARFRLMGFDDSHRSCAQNFNEALAELGYEFPFVPAPINLFMNIPWTDDGSISFEPTVSKPGDYVVLRAEMDAVVVFSACPQDNLRINGEERVPMPVEVEILPPVAA
ncbi:MAG: urea carboxylase-associated family protein [Actinobacteria bacterium]|nr:urea carboxylase-associated family protein [Actinomycetota bacterium]